MQHELKLKFIVVLVYPCPEANIVTRKYYFEIGICDLTN